MSRKRLSNRRRPPYEIKPTVIIIADGETEKDYINRLKELNYFKNVHLKFETGHESNFHIKLKEHLENKDNVFLILDIDNVLDGGRYEKIARLMNNSEYNIFYNNYSFETWLLNHKFNFASPIIESSQYNIHFKNHFDVDSWSENKNKSNRDKVMNQIDTVGIDTAVINIININHKRWDKNPSSNMDEFINKIKKIK